MYSYIVICSESKDCQNVIKSDLIIIIIIIRKYCISYYSKTTGPIWMNLILNESVSSQGSPFLIQKDWPSIQLVILFFVYIQSPIIPKLLYRFASIVFYTNDYHFYWWLFEDIIFFSGKTSRSSYFIERFCIVGIFQ